MFSWMFSKALLQLFQSTLMKRSMTEFGSVLRPFLPVFWFKTDLNRENLSKFLEMRLCPKCLQWTPILVASNNISKNRLDHRRYPSVHFDRYWVWKTCLRPFILQKKEISYHLMYSENKAFLKKSFGKLSEKSLYWTSLLRNFRSLIYNL